MEGNILHTMWVIFSSWEWPPVYSQYRNGDLCPIIPRNWILQTKTTKMLEGNFPQKLLDKNSAQPSPWFQPCETLSREPRQIMTGFWLTELLANKWVLFEVGKFLVICCTAIKKTNILVIIVSNYMVCSPYFIMIFSFSILSVDFLNCQCFKISCRASSIIVHK